MKSFLSYLFKKLTHVDEVSIQFLMIKLIYKERIRIMEKERDELCLMIKDVKLSSDELRDYIQKKTQIN